MTSTLFQTFGGCGPPISSVCLIRAEAASGVIGLAFRECSAAIFPAVIQSSAGMYETYDA